LPPIEPPTTTGNNGNMHGAAAVSIPAMKAAIISGIT